MMPPQEFSILLVDDDIDICANMADILGDLGYRVEAAHDGPSAPELVRNRPFDVALLDLRMPGMDGLTLYREIKMVRAGTAAWRRRRWGWGRCTSCPSRSTRPG
jgi:two-component system, NtrC family, response regulator HydG